MVSLRQTFISDLSVRSKRSRTAGYCKNLQKTFLRRIVAKFIIFSPTSGSFQFVFKSSNMRWWKWFVYGHSVTSLWQWSPVVPQIDHFRLVDTWATRFQPNINHGQRLKLRGQNLGRVFNSRLYRACVCCAIAYLTKCPSLKLKPRPKQLLGARVN